MRRQKDLDNAKLTGMVLALSIVKEKGIEGLERDIQARKRTGIDPPMYFYDLDKCTGDIRQWCLKRLTIAFMGAAHDAFGFGPKRMQKLLAKVGEAFALVRDGSATWWDYQKEIEKEMGIRMETTDDGYLQIYMEEEKKCRQK